MNRTANIKSVKVLPGFRLSLGITVFYLGLIILLPLSMLFLKSMSISWQALWHVVTAPRTLAALRLSISVSAAAAVINAVFGLLVAWVLVRYEFPFKKLMDAMVDLPFALPTAVAGISLTALYAPKGILGQFFYSLGIPTAFTPLGITIALTFIGLPFVVRTVEPVLQDIDFETEEAALSLGANRWQTFSKVLFPTLLPSLITGSAMAFARALGEYGSVVFIAGNMPYKTEILPLLIMSKLEQYEYGSAAAIAVTMLLISFAMLLALHALQSWSKRFQEAG